jgi:hypothetical protein
MLPYLLALAIDEVPATAATPTAPPHVFLHPSSDGCDSRAPAEEIVVCANRDAERYRLHPSENARYQEQQVRAEMKIGNATLALRADPRKIGDAQDDVHFTPVHSDLRLRFILPF